jgi:hypothetical protein
MPVSFDKNSRTLKIVSGGVLALLAAALAFIFFMPRQVGITAERILDKAYAKYDATNKCWIGDNQGQLYCFTLDRFDKVKTETGDRYYVLVYGEAVDENGKPNGGHITQGSVGAFVVEERNGDMAFIASGALIEVGASGSGPSKWQFVQLGPRDYWGWINEWGDCHQGYCGARYAILAPYGQKVDDLAGFASRYEDTGACGDEECEKKSSSIDSSLKVDDRNKTLRVFPLLITVTGKDGGKQLKSRTWKLSFDAKKWRYIEPEKWPLSQRDF